LDSADFSYGTLLVRRDFVPSPDLTTVRATVIKLISGGAAGVLLVYDISS
jgi:hypothetical protein